MAREATSVVWRLRVASACLACWAWLARPTGPGGWQDQVATMRDTLAERSPIGAQLRKLRVERGLSQAELAELADVSIDLVAKLEQGARQSARLSSLTKLAQALDVPLSELLDKRPRMEPSPQTGSLLAVRDVLLAPGELPGVDRHEDGGGATPATDLEAAVRIGWQSYWSGQLGRVAAIVPGLIGEARTSAAAVGAPAAGLLAQAYQLAACLMVHMGKDEIAAIATERALNAAVLGNDELQWATLHATYSWVLGHQGRYLEAEQHAIRVAERIEPVVSKAEAKQLTVWGGLLLTAVAAAAAAGRADECREYISWARAGAARLETDRYDYTAGQGATSGRGHHSNGCHDALCGYASGPA